MVLMHPGLKNRPFEPHNLIPVQDSPVPSLKFQMAPRLKLLMSSGSKKKEPRYTRCDNLIPRIVAACRWGVESGNLVYLSTFGNVPTCVYMSHRPNEAFVPKQQRKQYVSVVYSW